MYMINEATRIVRIPPSRLGEDIDAVVGPIASEMFEGRLEEDKSIAVLVSDVRTNGAPGRIVHGDGAVYQPVTFKQLVFRLGDNEIIEGRVAQIVQFGAFITFGPIDGLLHISQVMNDRCDADVVNQRLIGKESGRFLAVGDRVRARIISIEYNEKNPEDSKVGLTMRQPGLGKLEWIDEDAKRSKKGGDE